MSARQRLQRTLQSGLLFSAGIAVGCVPEIDDRTSIVQAPRLLGIASDPPEAAEGRSVTLTAFGATLDGEPLEAEWTACMARKPLTELGPVNAECLLHPQGEPGVALFLGRGLAAELTVPANACTLFGPERPDPKPGEPAGRPVDPDVTGGFYQPVFAWVGADATLGAVRLACPLAGASRENTVEFNQRYRPNQKPEIEALEYVLPDGSGAEPSLFARGEVVRFRIVVPRCGATSVCGDGMCGQREDRTNCAEDCASPRGCSGPETYAVYDPSTRSVVDRTESLVVTWYAGAGRFHEERTEAAEGGVVENIWTAPAAPGAVQLWFVLRDDRGGTDWRTVLVKIE